MTKEKNTRLSRRQQLAVLGRVLGYMVRHYKFSCLVVVVCILGTALATLAGTLFMQSLIDDYILPLTQAAQPDFAPLAAALGRLAAVYVLGILCAYGYNRIMVNVSQGTMRNLRQELFQHMESLPLRYFDTHAHGDIMSVYTNDVDTLRQLISQGIPQIINSLLSLVTALVAMFALSVPLSLLTVAVMVGMVLVTGVIATKAAHYFQAQQQDLGVVDGYIEEIMDGQKVVKVFCHEAQALEGFRQRNRKLFDSADKANAFGNITMPVNANLGNISYVLCAVVGALFALGGAFPLTLGTLISFLTLNKNATQPIIQISQQVNFVVMAMAGAQRVFALLDEVPEEDSGTVTLVDAETTPTGEVVPADHRTGQWAWKDVRPDSGAITYTPLAGEVVFDHVDFGYVPGKPILHDIQITAKPGQKIALVGSTGAGKTTITNLINRFYDIDGGKIRYDGIPIPRIRKGDLRRSLGMVLQDTHLFTGTVLDNLRYGRLDATDEECVAAAKLANADGFIRRLPDGYHTLLTGDGANLSQGQRQLLAIARAAVADRAGQPRGASGRPGAVLPALHRRQAGGLTLRGRSLHKGPPLWGKVVDHIPPPSQVLDLGQTEGGNQGEGPPGIPGPGQTEHPVPPPEEEGPPPFPGPLSQDGVRREAGLRPVQSGPAPGAGLRGPAGKGVGEHRLSPGHRPAPPLPELRHRHRPVEPAAAPLGQEGPQVHLPPLPQDIAPVEALPRAGDLHGEFRPVPHLPAAEHPLLHGKPLLHGTTPFLVVTLCGNRSKNPAPMGAGFLRFAVTAPENLTRPPKAPSD